MKNKSSLPKKETVRKIQSERKLAANRLLELLEKAEPVKTKDDKHRIREYVKRKFAGNESKR